MTTTNAFRRETRVLDGCTTSYLRGGNGPALLFLHGIEDLREPRPFMVMLAERFDVIVPDHPGYGRSQTPPWLDTIHDLTYFYLDFIKALELRDVHLVGHSLGGWVACELAVRATHGLRSLILVDAAGLRVIGVDGIDTFLCSPEELQRNLYADRRLGERARATDDDAVDAELRAGVMTARLAWEPRFYDRDLTKWLHRIDVPTLVVWGAEDRVFPPPYADAFARAIPGARVEIISGCGHLPHLERPDAFVERVRTFIGAVA